MKRFIVTTTIHEPSISTLKFCEKKDWQFIIVGDKKTPHESYEEIEKNYSQVKYLHPKEQEKKYSELSESMGWNCVERRNIGFLEAYNLGADIVASVDDDNIPYDHWGEEIQIGKEIECDCYEPEEIVFDPLSITKSNHLWHRGFPIQLLNKRKIKRIGKIKRKVLVQADLWNGDPDIDAIARIAFSPEINFDYIKDFYCSNKISPFNSQNTFFSRQVLPFYAVLPYIGRMEDIWGSFILQKFFPDSLIYGPPTVFQSRNKHNLVTDLENEMIGYKNTLRLLEDIDNFKNYLPKETVRFWDIYRKSFKN